MGHSHYPFVRSANGITFINVGSCGLPRDDGRFGAFATYDPVTKVVKNHRFNITKFVDELHVKDLQIIHPKVLQLFQRRSNNVLDNFLN
jgi:hypothetical protein